MTLTRPRPTVRALTRWWSLPASAVLVVVGVTAAGIHPALLPLVYLAAVTPALTAIDVLDRRLPDRLVLPGYAVAAAALIIQGFVDAAVPWLALVSGTAYFTLLFAFSAAGGMGFGDVKLAGVLGLTAGLLGSTASFASPLLAFLLGGVAALASLRSARGEGIPFGPSMLAGFWIAVLLS